MPTSKSKGVQQELFSEVETMTMLGVSRSTLQRWRDKGYIKFLKMGKKRKYTRGHIDEFLNKFNID